MCGRDPARGRYGNKVVTEIYEGIHKMPGVADQVVVHGIASTISHLSLGVASCLIVANKQFGASGRAGESVKAREVKVRSERDKSEQDQEARKALRVCRIGRENYLGQFLRPFDWRGSHPIFQVRQGREIRQQHCSELSQPEHHC